MSWLDKLANSNPDQVMKAIGEQGVTSLKQKTPRDTGQTANGWKYKLSRDKKVREVAWINNAHPELDVNLAVLIDLGHGTRNGGYVAPKPYIEDSMLPIFKDVGERFYKELIK